MEMTRKRVMEIAAIAGIVIVASVIIGFRMHTAGVAAKENALADQLRNVRSAVQLYFVVNNAYPSDLKTLTSEKYTIGNRRGLYLTGIVADKDNNPLDPFGNHFNYDPKNGKVAASESKYGEW